jgi:hypothetical protein
MHWFLDSLRTQAIPDQSECAGQMNAVSRSGSEAESPHATMEWAKSGRTQFIFNAFIG